MNSAGGGSRLTRKRKKAGVLPAFGAASGLQWVVDPSLTHHWTLPTPRPTPYAIPRIHARDCTLQSARGARSSSRRSHPRTEEPKELTMRTTILTAAMLLAFAGTAAADIMQY